MENFSAIDFNMARYVEATAEAAEMRPAEPWQGKDATDKARSLRLAKVQNSFWDFTTTYFSPEMYSDGYAKPAKFHKELIKEAMTPGLPIVLAPRKHGKTAVLKQFLVWKLLTGKLSIAGVYAETMTKSSNILKDTAGLIEDNERILFDFKPVFKENNTEQFQFKTTAKGTVKTWRYVAAFSEGKAVRGFTRLFGRPQFLFGDDVETLQSSMQRESVELRARKLYEAYQSLEDNSTFIVAGNDFDNRSALHKLRIEQQDGVISPEIRVKVYKAWDKKPLWKEKYPARSEGELKALCKPADESDWQSNFQMNPVPPEGYFFKHRQFNTFRELPADARGVIYCDPNLAKKSRGNTTGISKLYYSATLQKFLLDDLACVSFSDSNDLLDRVLKMKFAGKPVFAVAFDGHVSQESAWTNNIRNWCRITGNPYPVVHFRRYQIDDLAKNLQVIWENGDLLIREGLFDSKEGRDYLIQTLAFTGKKSNKTDDAPDSLIGALEFLFERKIPQARRRSGSVVRSSGSLTNDFNYTF